MSKIKTKRYRETGPVFARSMPFWCVANPISDPFGSPILPSISSIRVCDIICTAANEGLIELTSAHDDDLVLWDASNPEEISSPATEQLRQIKMDLDANLVGFHMITCNLHGHPLFRNGGLTNPDPKIRELARKKVERTLRIGKLLGARYFTYWVARDGFEVPACIPKEAYKWIAEGLNGVTGYIIEQGFNNYIGCTIEPKPNEPRGHMYLPTAGHAAAFTNGLDNPTFWGVNPELLQHEKMSLLDPVTCVRFLIHMKKLSFLHYGDQIAGQFDNDFPPLTSPEGLLEHVEMFRALRELNWRGVVEFDNHMLPADARVNDVSNCRLEFIRSCSYGLGLALILAERMNNFANRGLTQTQTAHAEIMTLAGIKPEAAIAASHR